MNYKKPLPKSLDIAQFLIKDKQLILPMLDLLTSAECAPDDLIQSMGRATIEPMVMMSATEVAGTKQRYCPTRSGRFRRGELNSTPL